MSEKSIQNTKVVSTYTKQAKFKSHSVIITKGFKRTEPVTQNNINSLKNLERGAQFNGYMSPATRRRVKMIVENFLTAIQLNTSMRFPDSFPSADVYPSFVTLTLPSKQIHCDTEIKRDVFGRFMEYLRDRSGWNILNYIWVSEVQENGNLHFHVVVDRGIPAKRLNEIWNRFTDRLGYVSRFRAIQKFIYKHGFFVREDMLNYRIMRERKKAKEEKKRFDKKAVVKAERERQRLAYKNGVDSDWSNPPSANIHAIQNIKKLTAYVSKYMTKEPEYDCKLEVGQKLIKENDRFYIVATVKKQYDLHRTTTDAAGNLRLVTYTHEVEEEEKKEVAVKFKNRKMHGFIWNASKPLLSDEINPFSVALEMFDVLENEKVTITKTTKKRKQYTRGVFGESLLTGYKDEIIESKSTESYYSNSDRIEDKEAIEYIDFLLKTQVKPEEVARASSFAGEHFQKNGGVIIPLSNPQKDFMSAYYPAFYKRYLMHYQNMFQFLYAN